MPSPQPQAGFPSLSPPSQGRTQTQVCKGQGAPPSLSAPGSTSPTSGVMCRASLPAWARTRGSALCCTQQYILPWHCTDLRLVYPCFLQEEGEAQFFLCTFLWETFPAFLMSVRAWNVACRVASLSGCSSQCQQYPVQTDRYQGWSNSYYLHPLILWCFPWLRSRLIIISFFQP